MPLGSGPIEFEGLGNEVTARVRNAILAGDLRDGDRIVERDLAAELGVSRGPVRDALRQLENEGLVDWTPRRGARVASLTREDAVEVVAIRQALEPLAVHFLLGWDEAERLEPLRACINQMRGASSEEDWSRLVTLDMEFHHQIYVQAGKRRLLRIWDSLQAPLLQTFRIHREFYDSSETVYRRHAELFDEIASGDVERAQEAIRNHVVDFESEFLERISSTRAPIDGASPRS
jgi:DNA-binding GntR family transcriptional regulator